MKRGMLRYEVREVETRAGHCLLLPKMTPAQMALMAERLRTQDFRVYQGRVLKASSRNQRVLVNPSGFAWSNESLSDILLPSIPRLLEAPKTLVSASTLLEMYMKLRRGTSPLIRFSPRIESGSTWTMLRSEDACGLSPDEGLMITTVLSRCADCELVTDFPTHRSKTTFARRKAFFASALSPADVTETLRQAGGRRERNSYLPRDGVVRVRGLDAPSSGEWIAQLRELGEWCYFSPVSRERSN
jgi:hypothetical protein